MDATSKTISLLRTLTLDGLLSADEIWALGHFFNEHPECAAAWPGDILSPMLASAFDDAQLSAEEMTVLAETIASIEQEWLEKTAPALSLDTAQGPSALEPALLPAIAAEVAIPQHDSAACAVNLREHTCTCENWRQREALPAGHPGRCCKHMAFAFARTGQIFEPWFQAVLDDCFAHARGTDPAAAWFLVHIPGQKPALLSGGCGPWCKVFAPKAGTYESFAFQPSQSRWSFGDAPSAANLIAQAIRKTFP